MPDENTANLAVTASNASGPNAANLPGNAANLSDEHGHGGTPPRRPTRPEPRARDAFRSLMGAGAASKPTAPTEIDEQLARVVAALGGGDVDERLLDVLDGLVVPQGAPGGPYARHVAAAALERIGRSRLARPPCSDPECSSGWVLNVDGEAEPCPACSASQVAAS